MQKKHVLPLYAYKADLGKAEPDEEAPKRNKSKNIEHQHITFASK